ncbi:MAG: dihydrodipicolinate synthase family protein [Myxococcota bacterium]
MTPRMHVMSITPFDARGALDEAALRAHVRRLADAGIGVFLGSYGTGEGKLLRGDEVRRLYAVGVEASDGRVPVVAAALGLGATDDVVERAREARALGVDAVQIHPPLAGPATIAPRENEIDAYYDAVLAALDFPLVLSNEVLMVGYGLAPERMCALAASHGQVVGINWTDPDPSSLARVVRGLADAERAVPVRVGLTAQLPLALVLGAEGLVSFEANVVPALCADVARAFDAGDLAAFRARFARLMDWNLALGRAMTPRSVKAVLAARGEPGTALRAPYRALDGELAHWLERDVARIEAAGARDATEEGTR